MVFKKKWGGFKRKVFRGRKERKKGWCSEGGG